MAHKPLNYLYILFLILVFGNDFIENASAVFVNLPWEYGRSSFPVPTGGTISGRMDVIDCGKFCLDAESCKNNGCYYDWRKEHCFQSSEVAAATYDVDYGYNIQIGNALCINVGGRQHWDADGFPFQADIQQGSNGPIYETNEVIADAREESQYIFQTQRRNRVMKFVIGVIHNNAPIVNFQARFFFAEYVERRRLNIIFNKVHVVKEGVDVYQEVGLNRAYEIAIPFSIQSGQLHVVGQSSPVIGNVIQILVSHTVQGSKKRMAAVNGLCGVRMHPCTSFCDNSAACNENPDCFYDGTTNHCVPKQNMGEMCRKFNGKKGDCETAGCEFCCETLACVEIGEVDAECNVGCREFCTNEIRCNDHGCEYDPANGKCEEKVKTCEHLVNVAHDPLENCLACTSNQCSYMFDTNPHLCVAEERVGNRIWGEQYYTQPQQCESNCSLHLTGDTQSICFGCVRSGRCVLKFESCKENPKDPECVPKDQATFDNLNPGETLIRNSTECQTICGELSNDPMKCRNSGCNFCCSSGECYAGHEQDHNCPVGCGSLCYMEEQCREFGCYFDPNTEQCLENRTACTHLNGSMEECLELNCEYCCKAKICFPSKETGIDTTPDPPPQVATKPGCCENSSDRIKTSCFLELEGHHIAGVNACMAANNAAYTGNFFKEECPHNHYKYECSTTRPFWSNCIFGGREMRFIGNETCKSVGAVFKNSVSATTCPPGSYRFLCGNERRQLRRSSKSSFQGRVLALRPLLKTPMDLLEEYERTQRHPTKQLARWKRAAYSETGLTGRMVDLTGCSRFCMDATLCQQNNCSYDHLNMHCLRENTGMIVANLDYGTDSPQSNAHCRNIGGKPHTDIWGFSYETDLSKNSWENSNARTFPASTRVTGIDQRDTYIHLSERQKRRVTSHINIVGGDGRYHIRLHFTELVYYVPKKRVVTIELNKRHKVKINFDMYAEAGFGNAIILGYGVEVVNGMLRVNGETSVISKNRIPVEVYPSQSSSRARSQMNAFCGIKMPPCTTFCGNPSMCDSAGDLCFTERRTNHCLPKTHFRTICEQLSGNRSMCDQQGCYFCCDTNMCHAEAPTETPCNVGCEQHCFYKDRCIAEKCKYVEETKICEDKLSDCENHIAELTNPREQCNACVLGMCTYIVQQDQAMCVDPTTPIADFQNVLIHFNSTAACDADPGLSNNKTVECRERGFKFCCSTMTCHHQNDTDWECANGCQQWCYNEHNCTSNNCYYNPSTNQCQNYPAVRPCDNCDRCERLTCEEAVCWWDIDHDMCFPETAMLFNRTDCESNSGIYCPCGIPRCISTSEVCTFPKNEEECLKEGCYFDCTTNTCTEERPIQVTFVIDITASQNIARFQQYTHTLLEMLRLRYENRIEFAITTHADYDGLSYGTENEHNDLEFGCYHRRIELSKNMEALQLIGVDISVLTNSGANNGISALTWTAADTKIGWSTNPLVHKVLWLITHTTDNGDLELPYIGNRQSATLDGTDTCSTSYSTRYAAAKEFFSRNRFAVFGNFIRVPENNLHDYWGERLHTTLGLPYGYVYTDSTDDDIVADFDDFINTLN